MAERILSLYIPKSGSWAWTQCRACHTINGHTASCGLPEVEQKMQELTDKVRILEEAMTIEIAHRTTTEKEVERLLNLSDYLSNVIDEKIDTIGEMAMQEISDAAQYEEWLGERDRLREGFASMVDECHMLQAKNERLINLAVALENDAAIE